MLIQGCLLGAAVLLSLLSSSGCSTPHDTISYHLLTTQSPYLCCRTLRYAVWEYAATEPSKIPGAGLTVRLLDDSLRVGCAGDITIGVAVANNGEEDVYIPTSYELEGGRIKLYPWRSFMVDGQPIRLARQLQFGDVVDREMGRLRFLRLPAGRQISLQGVIPQGWLCREADLISQDYLDAELNPTFYVDRARGIRAIRAAVPGSDTLPGGYLQLRYDVAYTTFGFLKQLPVTAQHWNPAHDTLEVRLAVKEEPSEFLNGSQRVVKSNTVKIVIIN